MDDWAEQFSDNYSTQDLHNEGVILKNASSWTEVGGLEVLYTVNTSYDKVLYFARDTAPLR